MSDGREGRIFPAPAIIERGIASISEENSAVADQASQGAHELLAPAMHMQGMLVGCLR